MAMYEVMAMHFVLLLTVTAQMSDTATVTRYPYPFDSIEACLRVAADLRSSVVGQGITIRKSDCVGDQISFRAGGQARSEAAAADGKDPSRRS